jgi:hypothetical protein
VLVLNPRTVTFGAATWANVSSVAIDRQAARLIEEPGDNGPYAVLVDVAEQRVRVKVVQEFTRDEMSAPALGDQATLQFYTAPGLSSAGSRKVSMTAAVIGVEHEVSLKRGATRTIELSAVSSDGRTDPVAIADA